MNFLPDEQIYITYEEMCVILAAVGRKGIYIVDSFEDATVPGDEKSVYPIMASLYQKGLLEWEDDKAVFPKIYRPVLKALRDAKYVMIAAAKTGEQTIKESCFGSGVAMTMETSRHDRNVLKLSFETDEELIARLEEEEIFPGPVQKGKAEPEERFMEPDEGKTINDCLKDEDVHAVLELRNADDGTLDERVIVSKGLLFSVMYRQEKGKSRYFVIEDEIWKDMITSWLKRGAK